MPPWFPLVCTSMAVRESVPCQFLVCDQLLCVCSWVNWSTCASTCVQRRCSTSTTRMSSRAAWKPVERKASSLTWRSNMQTTCPASTSSLHWWGGGATTNLWQNIDAVFINIKSPRWRGVHDPLTSQCEHFFNERLSCLEDYIGVTRVALWDSPPKKRVTECLSYSTAAL